MYFPERILSFSREYFSAGIFSLEGKYSLQAKLLAKVTKVTSKGTSKPTKNTSETSSFASI